MLWRLWLLWLIHSRFYKPYVQTVHPQQPLQLVAGAVDVLAGRLLEKGKGGFLSAEVQDLQLVLLFLCCIVPASHGDCASHGI